MAKKVRNKSNKLRSFKVHVDYNGKPFVRFGGKYLVNELGINYGDRLEMTRDGNMIILRKFSADEVEAYETARHAKALLKKLLPMKQKAPVMMVDENRSRYSVDEEMFNHVKSYLQA